MFCKFELDTAEEQSWQRTCAKLLRDELSVYDALPKIWGSVSTAGLTVAATTAAAAAPGLLWKQVTFLNAGNIRTHGQIFNLHQPRAHTPRPCSGKAAPKDRKNHPTEFWRERAVE